MQKWHFLSFCITCSNLIYSHAKMNYSNNQAAGKYYAGRGIKMYAAAYGSGKPLLLIHGNGEIISAMASIIPYYSWLYKVIVFDSRALVNQAI